MLFVLFIFMFFNKVLSQTNTITCENRLDPPPPDHSGVKIKMLARRDLRISECWLSGNKLFHRGRRGRGGGEETYVYGLKYIKKSILLCYVS